MYSCILEKTKLSHTVVWMSVSVFIYYFFICTSKSLRTFFFIIITIIICFWKRSLIWWPRELNALQIEKNTCKLRKHLHQFDSRCCKCSQHNQIKKRTANKILFGCVVSICSTCCQTDEDVFLICRCFFYVHVFSEVAALCSLGHRTLMLTKATFNLIKNTVKTVKKNIIAI